MPKNYMTTTRVIATITAGFIMVAATEGAFARSNTAMHSSVSGVVKPPSTAPNTTTGQAIKQGAGRYVNGLREGARDVGRTLHSGANFVGGGMVYGAKGVSAGAKGVKSGAKAVASAAKKVLRWL